MHVHFFWHFQTFEAQICKNVRFPSARANLSLGNSLGKSYGILWIVLKVTYRERGWIAIQHLDHILALEGQPTHTQEATATPGLPEPPHGMALAINSRKKL